MKFLLDESMPRSSVNVLEELNLEVEHIRDIGMVGVPDNEIVDYARENKEIIIAKDIEFGNILTYPPSSHCGVVILRLPFWFTARQINNVLRGFLESVEVNKLENSITIVELGRYRIRDHIEEK